MDIKANRYEITDIIIDNEGNEYREIMFFNDDLLLDVFIITTDCDTYDEASKQTGVFLDLTTWIIN